MQRQKTGEGQWIEGALLGTALTVGNSLLIEQAVIAPDRRPSGNRAQTSAPSDIIRCRDGHILIAVVGDPLFRRFARLIGQPELIDDPRFKTDIDRGDNGEALSAIARRWAAELTCEDALAALGKAMVPAAKVMKPQETLDDPHIAALRFFQHMDFPGMARPAPIAKVPIWYGGEQKAIRHRAPTLGEHTDRILTGLGFSDRDIARLRASGAV